MKMSEIVRLELLELSRSALQQYATKFKGDGISQADMMQMYDQVERTVTGISATADTTEHKKGGHRFAAGGYEKGH